MELSDESSVPELENLQKHFLEVVRERLQKSKDDQVGRGEVTGDPALGIRVLCSLQHDGKDHKDFGGDGDADKDVLGVLRVHKDADYVENPREREDVEAAIKVRSLRSVEEVVRASPEVASGRASFRFRRVPTREDRGPDPAALDRMVEALRGQPVSTQCVFSCQMGRGRTTIGEAIVYSCCRTSCVWCNVVLQHIRTCCIDQH